jgi:hypothetical protein
LASLPSPLGLRDGLSENTLKFRPHPVDIDNNSPDCTFHLRHGENHPQRITAVSTNFRDLIKKAIAIEAKMAEFYGTMTTKATTPETREIFKILSGEEEEHRVLLENYLEKG